MHKIETNARRLEFVIHETEQKYLAARKEAETGKNTEILQNEIESLRKELKNQEVFSYGRMEEIKHSYEAQIKEISENFKNYQKQSEDLASNQQTVIKNLVEKSKKLKQKIISQKSKLSDSQKHSNLFENVKSGYLKTIGDLEEKLKIAENEGMSKENELLAKHQSQISQLQMQYQHMMENKLAEMQKEVDSQIFRSQEHDREVKSLMDLKMKEIEREYILKSLHEKLLNEKELILNKKSSAIIEDIKKGKENIEEDLKKEIFALKNENDEISEKLENTKKIEDSLKKEILREKEKLGSEINAKLLKLKESENSRLEAVKDLEKLKQDYNELKENFDENVSKRIKSEKEIIFLNDTISDLKNSLNSTKQSLQANRAQYEQILFEKVDKSQYFQEKEKNNYLESEIEKKSVFISRLEEELNSLQSSLKESKANHSEDLNLFELEQSRHEETKIQLRELENYSQKLLHEVEIRETKQNETKNILETYKEEIRKLSIMIENKDKEYFTFKQQSLNKDVETRNKFKVFTERIKKYVKNSVFFLKKQLAAVAELVEHECLSINKNFSSIYQEISIKIIEMQLKYRKDIDFKAEEYSHDIKKYYKSRFSQLEELISQENIH